MTHLPFLVIIKIQLPSNSEGVLDGDWKIQLPSNTPHHQMVTTFTQEAMGGWFFYINDITRTHPPLRFLGDKNILVTIQHTPVLDQIVGVCGMPTKYPHHRYPTYPIVKWLLKNFGRHLTPTPSNGN
jgi:hypothetical protein